MKYVVTFIRSKDKENLQQQNHIINAIYIDCVRDEKKQMNSSEVKISSHGKPAVWYGCVVAFLFVHFFFLSSSIISSFPSCCR